MKQCFFHFSNVKQMLSLSKMFQDFDHTLRFIQGNTPFAASDKPTSIYRTFQNPYCLKCHTDWESFFVNSKSETTHKKVHRWWLQAVVLKNIKKSKWKISPSCWRETWPSKNRGVENLYSVGFSSGHQWLEIPWFLGNKKKTLNKNDVKRNNP